MARTLKTYQTTGGFFDLAVAAPSMKAALELWGSASNLFQSGFAKETNDPEIVKATMANPGVVLRRPVGSNGPFKVESELPKLSALAKAEPAKKPAPARKKPDDKVAKEDKAAERKAAELYDLAQKRRERDERKAAAERQ